MHMTMLTDRRAAIDDAGTVVADLHAGATYDLPAGLADRYLERGYARNANGDELTVPGPVAPNDEGETKDAGASPEDKDGAPAAETKTQPRVRKPRRARQATEGGDS